MKKKATNFETKHHRKPRSLQGSHEQDNISYVRTNKHSAWHLLFGNYTPEMIAKIITSVWLDPEFKMVAFRRTK